jgi:chromosome segregation ATPase
VNNLAGARGRGVIPETRFLALDRRVAEVTGDIAELIGRVARNGRERAQIERSIEAVDQDYLIEVREAANQARARRADLEREIEGALAQLGVADRLSSYIAMRERERERERTATGEISILRRADDGGWVTVVADLTTELLPGDVLQVPMSSGLTRPRVQTANRADESG